DRGLLRGRGRCVGAVADVDRRADHDDRRRLHGGRDHHRHVHADVQDAHARQVVRAYHSAVVRWALLAAVPLVVAAAVSLGFVLTSGSAKPMTASSAMPAADTAAATWPARRLLAPGFTLRGENGARLSLASFRG